MAWQRLSGADALSLNIETPTTPAHQIVLIVMDPADGIGHQRLHELAGSSLPRLAHFRSRLFGKPLGLGQPVWAEVNDFDPSRQLYRVALPPPGGPSEFADLIAKLTTRTLVRHKPLWQAWSIEGLADGRWALALKVSQAMVGGAEGLASILARLLTVGPDDDPTTYLPPEPSLGKSPSLVELVSDTAAEFTGNQLVAARMAGAAVPAVLRAVAHRLLGGDGHDDTPVPRTVFNEPLTPQREVAFTELPQADVDAVADAFKVSADDVFLAACALSLRTWLQRHGAPTEHPLLFGNPFSPASAPIRIPVQHDDPLQILTEVHADRGREKGSELPALAQLVPPNLLHAGVRIYGDLELSRRFGPFGHGVAASINGPPVPVYCAGAPVTALYVVPPLVQGAGLSITQLSHDGIASVAVCACPDRVTDVAEIADGIAYGVMQLRAKNKKSKKSAKVQLPATR